MPVVVIICGTVVVVVVAGGLAVYRTLQLVPEGVVAVVERFGRYHRVAGAGPLVLRPFDRVRSVVDVREQIISFQPQPMFTADNIVLNIDAVVSIHIVEPKLAVYSVDNPIRAIENLALTTMRENVADKTFAEVLRSRRDLNAEVGTVLNKAARL